MEEKEKQCWSNLFFMHPNLAESLVAYDPNSCAAKANDCGYNPLGALFRRYAQLEEADQAVVQALGQEHQSLLYDIRTPIEQKLPGELVYYPIPGMPPPVWANTEESHKTKP